MPTIFSPLSYFFPTLKLKLPSLLSVQTHAPNTDHEDPQVPPPPVAPSLQTLLLRLEAQDREHPVPLNNPLCNEYPSESPSPDALAAAKNDEYISSSDESKYGRRAKEPGVNEGDVVERLSPATVVEKAGGGEGDGRWRMVYEGPERVLVKRKGRGKFRYGDALREGWTGDNEAV
jgi:hypothetical protein